MLSSDRGMRFRASSSRKAFSCSPRMKLSHGYHNAVFLGNTGWKRRKQGDVLNETKFGTYLPRYYTAYFWSEKQSSFRKQTRKNQKLLASQRKSVGCCQIRFAYVVWKSSRQVRNFSKRNDTNSSENGESHLKLALGSAWVEVFFWSMQGNLHKEF